MAAGGQHPFLTADTLKAVVSQAELVLSRAYNFRLFDVGAETLRAAAAAAMRQASRGPGTPTTMLAAAVDALVARMRAEHHLDKGSVREHFDRLAQERGVAPGAPPAATPPAAVEVEPPPAEADLRRAVERKLAEREGSLAPDPPPVQPPQPQQHQPPEPVSTRPPPMPEPARVERLRQVVVSSLDRDWTLSAPQRCRYQVKWTNPVRDVVSVEIDRLVIPAEIVLSQQDSSINQLTYRYRVLFETSYAFNLPFVLVNVDELPGDAEGTSDAIRRALGALSYHSHFQDVNGRGYIVLKPTRGATRVYRPPLAVLPSLSVSLLSPSGGLLNRGADGLAVLSFTNTTARASLIQVTTAYFDRNECYVGDYVMFSAYSGADPLAAAFVARPEGHQVYDMGTLNTDAYYNSFWIRAPGAFDPLSGEYLVDATTLDAVTADGGTAQVLNMSLQNTLFLKVTTMELQAPEPFAGRE